MSINKRTRYVNKFRLLLVIFEIFFVLANRTVSIDDAYVVFTKATTIRLKRKICLYRNSLRIRSNTITNLIRIVDDPPNKRSNTFVSVICHLRLEKLVIIINACATKYLSVRVIPVK